MTGRPTKYTPELIDKARYYTDHWQEIDEVIPSIAGLAIYLGIRRETVHAWDKDPEKDIFSNIVSEIAAKQERELTTKGLISEFNSSIAKLMLTKHGYSDKSDNTLSGPGGKPLEVHTEVQWNIVDPQSTEP